MSYTKQELLDWIDQEMGDDDTVAFINFEVGEESLIDDLFVEVEEIAEEFGEDFAEEFGLDEPADKIISLG